MTLQKPEYAGPQRSLSYLVLNSRRRERRTSVQFVCLGTWYTKSTTDVKNPMYVDTSRSARQDVHFLESELDSSIQIRLSSGAGLSNTAQCTEKGQDRLEPD